MSELIEEFISATVRVLECLNAAVESESEKRKALLENDLARVEAMLQSQQALVMRLENTERRRILAAEAAGFEGMSAKEVEAAVTDEAAKGRLSALFLELREKSALLKSLNKASLDIANVELKLMSEHPAITKDDKRGGLYDSSGRKGQGNSGGTYNGTF